MTKKKLAEDLLQDVTRLARGVFYWRDWHVEQHEREHGADAPFPYDTYVCPGQFMATLVPNGFEDFEKVYATDQDTLDYWLTKIDPSQLRIAHAKHILRDLQSWYSHTASDIRALRSHHAPDAYSDFLDAFHHDIGFDFMSESGSVRRLALKVLKQGKISSQSDWETLQELRVDISQSILSQNELAKLSNLMDAYEAAQ